ncbi:MAG: hypothetical protein IPI24_02090 [Ignavibacteria bacterium]|nr:hypothetical protein [Ignavibacteria bacterium]
MRQIPKADLFATQFGCFYKELRVVLSTIVFKLECIQLFGHFLGVLLFTIGTSTRANDEQYGRRSR